jgi:hypothetical protein
MYRVRVAGPKERAVPQDSPGATKDSANGELPDLDTSVANAARMWNYWIGGKDNFLAASSLMITPRDGATVARFFDGLEMTGPGLLPLAQWWGSSPATTAGPGLSCYCGVARKP